MLLLQMKVLDLLERVKHDEEGQGVVEYGLILGLVVVGAIGALEIMGGKVSSTLNDVASAL